MQISYFCQQYPNTKNNKKISSWLIFFELSCIFTRTNANLISQVELMLNDYREESMRRDRERTQKANETAEDKGKNWDDLIDI